MQSWCNQGAEILRAKYATDGLIYQRFRDISDLKPGTTQVGVSHLSGLASALKADRNTVAISEVDSASLERNGYCGMH